MFLSLLASSLQHISLDRVLRRHHFTKKTEMRSPEIRARVCSGPFASHAGANVRTGERKGRDMCMHSCVRALIDRRSMNKQALF